MPAKQKPPQPVWYAAKLLVCDTIQGAAKVWAWENVHLIRAKKESEALQKANKLGKTYNDSHKNAYGQTVKCQYFGVMSLIELMDSPDKFKEGAEVWWDLRFRKNNPKYLKRLVRPEFR